MIDAEATERFMAAPWLAEVDPETKRAIAGALVEARAPTGATLLEQGQPNDHLTFLIEGTAEIVRTFGAGRRDVITQLTAPAVFGTTSFFQPKPPTVTVQATSEVWMLSLYHPAHEALRGQPPRRRSARPGGRPRLVRTVRPDRQAASRNSRPSHPMSRRGTANGPGFAPACSRSLAFRRCAGAMLTARNRESRPDESIAQDRRCAGDRRSSVRLGG